MTNYIEFKRNSDFLVRDLDEIVRAHTNWAFCVKARCYYEFTEDWIGKERHEAIILKVSIHDKKWGTTICSKEYKEPPHDLFLDFKELLWHTTKSDLGLSEDDDETGIMALISSLIKGLKGKD